MTRYVAIGDSFTEGVGDERPDGSARGWADLVAAGLAAARPEGIAYANLAVRGRLLEPIVTEQLEAAPALDPAPTLLTLNGGGNDMLRPKADVEHLAALVERAVRRCAASGVRIVLLSGADPAAQLPFGRTVHARAALLTERVRALADAHGVELVDVFGDQEIRRPGYWSPDRLHLNTHGHARAAALVLAALGEATAADAVSPAAPRRGLTTELRYYREHVLPWVGRRLRHRSSGDGRSGKAVAWTVLP
jgi:lysophospholipase L1-like esterase